MPFSNLTLEQAVAALAGLGVKVDRQAMKMERRDDRWLIHLPGHRMAWFAASMAGRDRLSTDRKILRLIEKRCSFQAPRVLAEDPQGDFDVRAMVEGASNPVALYEAVNSDDQVAKQAGRALGSMLAELHTCIRSSDIENFVQGKPDWPESRDWILERLPAVVDDRELFAEADKMLSRYEQTAVASDDRVLVHGDLGMHAIAYDPESYRVNGIFDFEGAAYADRHVDFRYLKVGNNTKLLEAALAAYEPIIGRSIDRDRVQLYQAVCALSYLAFRKGHEPDETWCGRTLDADLAWTRAALQACA